MNPTGERDRERDDLPILDEIGTGLSAAFAREERAAVPVRRRRLRRIAIATAALFVVVPGAVATRYIWAPEPASVQPNRPFAGSRPIQIAEGRGESLRWRISGYRSKRGVCSEMTVFNATEFGSRTGGVCVGELAPGTALVLNSAGGFGESIIHGWIAPAVARVEVEVGGRPRRTAEIIKIPADRAARAGLPRDLQFYVAIFPGEIDVARGLRAIALDSSGREVDRGEVSPRPSR